jgi:hypothetical protein
MSNCSNCYNGCTEIVSDRCVKYTGIDVPVLGIQTGDSLSFVEQALITFLTAAMDGTGVKIDLTPTVVCELVQKYLPTCGDLSILDISKALIEAACDLQEQVDAIVADLAILNGDYTIGCLTGVTASSDTHSIVQAVINKLCQVQVDLTAITLELHTQYVRYDELDALIQDYLDNTPGQTLISNRMVPYAVVEYYGPRTYFDGTGKGLGDWDKIYLCNGLNGTPDKRGVVGVGITDGSMLGLAMPAATNPLSGNPTYSLSSTIIGSNGVVLTTAQMPSHTHNTVVTINDPTHKHDILGISGGDNNDNNNVVRFAGGDKNQGETGFYFTNTEGCQLNATGLRGTGDFQNVFVTNMNQGGGDSHANYQPGLGCYYIQYRP